MWKKVPWEGEFRGLFVEFAQLCLQYVGFRSVTFVVDEMDKAFVVAKVELYHVIHIAADVLALRFGGKQGGE